MKILKLLIVSIGFMTLVQSQLQAEYVFLKDGSILKCKIESESASAVVLALADGSKKTVSPKNIMRILFTELYMGKIFVNKIDGSVIEVYMVDEDQTSYTFRKELYRPDEFKLKREEVLFTARKNPVGLKGAAMTDIITIDWKPPYNPVKKYKIYIKSGSDYKLYGETGRTNETLNGLKSNTPYSIKVTAIDKENYESLPSNEIIITTLNIPPYPPAKLRCKRIVTETPKNAKNIKKPLIMTAKLSWEAAIDGDGKINKYNIYLKDKKNFTAIANTPKTEYDVTGLDPDKNYYYTVRSVDNKDGESANSRVVNTLDLKGYNIAVDAWYIKPLGRFGGINAYGAGATASFVYTDFLFENCNAAVVAGYWAMKGKDPNAGSSFIVPVMGSLNYKFEIGEYTSVVPRISAGYSYVDAQGNGENSGHTVSGFEPVVMAGMAVSFDLTEIWYINAGANYGALIETGGHMQFAAGTLSCGRKF